MKAMKIRHAALGIALLLVGFAPATAQEWPSRNVTVVVPIFLGASHGRKLLVDQISTAVPFAIPVML